GAKVQVSTRAGSLARGEGRVGDDRPLREHRDEHVLLVDGDGRRAGYRLLQSVAKSGNALRWMRHTGLRVDEPA
ncbi:MAG: hypothetical protein MUF54_06940, partial [Polyangiaceae bacterium]|nr:hypothetical protein [Polyangiaceae bacterium]